MKLAASQAARAARGSKHRCEACETPFYDLMRSPIVCPSCGSQFTPRVVEVKPPGAAKNRWRQNFAPRPMPVVEQVAANDGAVSDPVSDEEMIAEDVTSSLDSDDDSVPEEVQEDGDVSGLLDVDKAEGD